MRGAFIIIVYMVLLLDNFIHRSKIYLKYVLAARNGKLGVLLGNSPLELGSFLTYNSILLALTDSA